MKKIIDYRKFLGVTENAELGELKTVYRNLMKSWHPDKFNDNHELKQEAEEKRENSVDPRNMIFKSKRIISK